jgi:esterase/lipase superfamily enzyme
MSGEYLSFPSTNLGQALELKVYGTGGRPMLVFPTVKGRFVDYENFGMVAACQGLLDAGKLTIFAVDGVDAQSWASESAHPYDRALRHNQYDACVAREVVPLIRARCRASEPRDLIVTGCSFGAYHAAHFLFRHPDLCNAVIALSGIYSLNYFLGDYCDREVYFNDPLRYLPNLTDRWYLDRLKESRIILCCGQGAWEEYCLQQSRALAATLQAKGIPHMLDLWGHDVYHDWPWWQKQIVYFLGKLGLT